MVERNEESFIHLETIVKTGLVLIGGTVVVVTAPIWAPYAVTGLTVGARYAWQGAKLYHNTFGKNGGYLNAAGNFTSQTIANKGDLSKTNLLGVVLSSFVIKKNGLVVNGVLNGIASGGLIRYNANGSYGTLLDNPYHSGLTTINGILLEPTLSPFGRTIETVGTGTYQGFLNYTEDKLD